MANATTSRREFSLGRLVATLALVAIAAGVAYQFGVQSVERPDESDALMIYGMDRPVQNRLHAQYTDADRDLVADPPKDESERVDPDVLNFSYLVSEQDRYREVWDDFLEYLAEKTGKQVEYLAINGAMDQLRALRDGKLHVTGINTGAVPLAVNACGFVPVCGFGNDSGLVSYTMRIVVAAESEISAIADLAGRTLTLTTPTSNSGWKAPLMILKRDFNLLPVRDFAVNFSNGHAESLQGIATGQYEIAAVASDEIDLAVERGVIDKGDLRIIYESARFPNNVLGRAHNLSPELAENVRDAFLSYDWADTAIHREFSAFGARRFAPIAYEADLRLVREIDDAMGRRHIIGDTLPDFDDDRSADRAEASE